jgi:hypothetical protein
MNMTEKILGGAPKGREGKEEPKTELDILREEYTRAIESNDGVKARNAADRILGFVDKPNEVKFAHRDLSAVFDAFAGNQALTKRLQKALLDQLDIKYVNGEPVVRVFNREHLDKPTEPLTIYTRLDPRDGNFFRKENNLWGISIKHMKEAINQNSGKREQQEQSPTQAVSDVLSGHREALRREQQIEIVPTN